MNQSKPSTAVIEPVIKEIEVSLSVEKAFELFTQGLGSWWPLDKGHSVGGERARTCAMEGRVGGRLFETLDDGTEHCWGTIQTWQEPTRFVTTWHPGNSPEFATLLEVSFSATDNGALVRLIHSGWEARGTAGAEYREGYQTGWDRVLARYTTQAETIS